MEIPMQNGKFSRIDYLAEETYKKNVHLNDTEKMHAITQKMLEINRALPKHLRSTPLSDNFDKQNMVNGKGIKLSRYQVLCIDLFGKPYSKQYAKIKLITNNLL